MMISDGDSDQDDGISTISVSINNKSSSIINSNNNSSSKDTHIVLSKGIVNEKSITTTSTIKGIDYFSKMPYELIIYILSFIKPFEIVAKSRVSKLFYSCCKNNGLWRELVTCNCINNSLLNNNQRHGQNQLAPPNYKDININWVNYFAEVTMMQQYDSMVWSTPQSNDNELLNRYRHSSTSFKTMDGKMKFMIIGGTNPEISTVRSDILILDPYEISQFKINKPIIKKVVGVNKWVEMAEMDIGISRHTAEYIEGVGVVLFGGSRVVPDKMECSFSSLTTHSVKSNSIDIINYENGEIIWKPINSHQQEENNNSCNSSIPTPRSDHASACIGMDMYIFGGSDEAVKPLNDLHILHTDSMRWERVNCTGDVPSPRSGHAMISVGTKIYLYGGGVWDKKKKCWVARNNQLFVFDSISCVWKEIRCQCPPMSTFSSLFAVGHHLFILFGSITGLMSHWSYRFDTITSTWFPLKGKNTPVARNSASVCICNHKIYFIGGTNKKTCPIDILEMNWVQTLKKCSYDIMIKG